MTTCFYQASSFMQSILLVISQFSVISLATGLILLFKRKCKITKISVLFGVFVLDVVLYVVMQLDSRMTNEGQGLHLHVPYIVLLCAILLFIGVEVWILLGETRNRKTINNTSIKEAFDNLPTGVCFFNESGLPVLCNLSMYRFSFAVCGKDVQFITDLENCFAFDFIPENNVKKEGKVFVLKDGTSWHLEKRNFTYDGGSYTQYVATNVSEIQKTRVELQAETEHLRKVQAELKRLSANVVAVTREEEILNTKMRVHDEMGKCLVEARKLLSDGADKNISESLVASWQKAVSMIKYTNENEDEDMLSQIRKTCASVGLEYVQRGILPNDENSAYILTCAVRECVTNAVRYAEASKLYATFEETDIKATVTVTNNGKKPESEIVEGGGLSTLRRRVERSGGTMTVDSFPAFRLTVTIPKKKEGLL